MPISFWANTQPSVVWSAQLDQGRVKGKLLQWWRCSGLCAVEVVCLHASRLESPPVAHLHTTLSCCRGCV